ncbi:cutinase-domain-containing protein [Cladorrhinum sp. PSN332]|nr:cutinase-domain-containing protein [Cladorrhinum sp. PSN332]
MKLSRALFLGLACLTAATPSDNTPAEATGRISWNTYLYWITKLFPLNSAIDRAGHTVARAEKTIASVLRIKTTRNIPKRDPCTDITILFARGTNEVGNLGTIVGPAFFDAVEDLARKKNLTVAMQGTNYNASTQGYLYGGDPQGGKKMRRDLRHFLHHCPKTKIVLSGYAQGAQVLRNSFRWMPSLALRRRISSVVVFSDPKHPELIRKLPGAKQLSICHERDNICFKPEVSNVVRLAHWTYGKDVGRAAEFVMAHVGGRS